MVRAKPGLGRRLAGGILAIIGLYPIVTANHLQNLISGFALFLIGVGIFAWGCRDRDDSSSRA